MQIKHLIIALSLSLVLKSYIEIHNHNSIVSKQNEILKYNVSILRQKANRIEKKNIELETNIADLQSQAKYKIPHLYPGELKQIGYKLYLAERKVMGTLN